jgi:hypothetical protein
MKKQFLLLLISLCSFAALQAQNYSASGIIISGEDKSPLPGAYVLMKNQADGSEQESLTDGEGRFRMEKLKKGAYEMTVSFLGFQDLKQSIEIIETRTSLGQIELEPSSERLEEVEVKDLMPRAEQKGDTTQFNAEAFKVNRDASAEELMKKMPGVVVQDGKVQAQGEDVKEVLVDGKPFFGNDPNAALKTLPAEVIDKIQVFDKQSEQSQFTGFDDGNTTKAINIITKTDARAGQFGKVYAGYGNDLSENGEFDLDLSNDSRYQAGGNVNLFNGDQRISIIGQSNNINQQNFATEDLVGVMGSTGGRGRRGRGGRGGGDLGDFLVGQQNGIAQTHALGINYTDEWGKKIKVNGSYFFNQSEVDTRQILFQEFFDDKADFNQTYEENSFTTSKNINHRLNFRFDYEIDDRNSIRMRPNLSLQYNDGSEQTLGQNLAGASLLNESDYNFSSDLAGINFSNDIRYRHRFAKRGRTLSIGVESKYNENSGESFLLSENRLFSGQGTTDTLDQFNDLLSDGLELQGEISFSEPLGEKAQLSLEYEIQVEDADSDKETFDFDEGTSAYSDLNTVLTNIFTSNYTTHQASVGYRLRGEKAFFFSRLRAEWAELNNEQAFPYEATVNQSFFNLLPFAMYRYQWTKQKNLRVFYRTGASLPSVSQLQDVIDNSNPLQLSTGNPDLKQNFQHRLFMRYSDASPEKGTVFFAYIGGTYTDNYVGSSLFIARRDTLLAEGVLLPRGGQLTRPVNLDGNYSLRSFLTYGLPLQRLKTNMNLDLNANYQRQPGIINGRTNFSNNTSLSLGVTFSSNISERVDFTLSTRGSYTDVQNSVNTQANNAFYSQRSEVGINLIFGAEFIFRTNLAHQFFDGLADDVDQDFLLWNASLGKKFLKDNRGEISLFVFDILRQNVSVQRNITDTYLQDTQTDVLQQYFLVKFLYRISNFGSPPQEEERGRGDWRGRW